MDAVDSPVVAAYGPGLSYGVAGEPCSFTIDTKNAGAGMNADPLVVLLGCHCVCVSVRFRTIYKT